MFLELGLSLFWSLFLIGSTFNSAAGTCFTTVHTKFHDILATFNFVPATCPTKFNKLNSVRHVAGTKYPPNQCCTIIKVSVYTRGHVAATYPWDMYPQHFHVCKCCNFVPATCPRYTSLLHVASVYHTQVFCPCNMTPRVCPPLWFPLFTPLYELQSNL